jgi:AcrR family transcriptional regulator
MARRSDHSRDELYDMAMTAAQEIVQQEGLRALTARSLAAAIGYSPGTLYNLFENLDELALHVNASTLDALYAAVAQDGISGEPDGDLTRMLQRYLAFLDAHPALWNAIFDYARPTAAALPQWYLGRVQRLMQLVERALSPLFAAGEERELRQAAAVLWSSLHGICTLAQDGRLSLVSAQSVPQMAQSLIANYLTGLRARAGKRVLHA